MERMQKRVYDNASRGKGWRTSSSGGGPLAGLGLLPVVLSIAILLNVMAPFLIGGGKGGPTTTMTTTGGPPFLRPPRPPANVDNDNDGTNEKHDMLSSFDDVVTNRRKNIDVLLPPNITRDVDDDVAFCDSIRKGMTFGSNSDRVMIHVLVSNAGHYPFLHNILLSMIRGKLHWKPVIFAIGGNLCPLIEEDELLRDNAICVPYLGRLLYQLTRDEPESMVQIRDEAKVVSDNNDHHNDNANMTNNMARIMDVVDNTFYGWGAVEHKFLINAKLYALRDVLHCGYDAFVTDTDVGFRSDPRPFLGDGGGDRIEVDNGGFDGDVAAVADAWDVVAQNDTNPSSYPLNINSGFMYWRWTPSNVRLIRDVITVPPFWHIDQARVNSIMMERDVPCTILDRHRFPNGNMYLNHRNELIDDDIVAFHANYNDKMEQKVDMLRSMGLWYLPVPG